MSKIKLIIFTSILFSMLVSCISKRNTTSIGNKLNLNEIKTCIDTSQISYKHLAYKFNADFITDSETTNLTGNLRICKDSLIWISIRKFRIEGLRILIKKDSLFVLDRVNKIYFKGNYSDLDSLGLDYLTFNLIQNIFTNTTTNNLNSNDKYNLRLDSNKYIFATLSDRNFNKFIEKDKADIVYHRYDINNNTCKLEKDYIYDFQYNTGLEIDYSNFVKLENKLHASNIYIKIIDKDLEFKFVYNSLAIKDNQSYSFKKPSKYTEKTIAELLSK